jgi:hypothetical protein
LIPLNLNLFLLGLKCRLGFYSLLGYVKLLCVAPLQDLVYQLKVLVWLLVCECFQKGWLRLVVLLVFGNGFVALLQQVLLGVLAFELRLRRGEDIHLRRSEEFLRSKRCGRSGLVVGLEGLLQDIRLGPMSLCVRRSRDLSAFPSLSKHLNLLFIGLPTRVDIRVFIVAVAVPLDIQRHLHSPFEMLVVLAKHRKTDSGN